MDEKEWREAARAGSAMAEIDALQKLIIKTFSAQLKKRGASVDDSDILATHGLARLIYKLLREESAESRQEPDGSPAQDKKQ